MNNVWGAVRGQPVLWLAAALLAMLVVVVSLNGRGPSKEEERLQDRLEQAQRQVEAARLERDIARERTSELEQQVRRLKEQAGDLRSRARDAEDRARQELADERAALDERERAISAQEKTLSQTISDGIWQLGRDYEAGTYRAPGGPSCYWALLGSANTDDIINNGGFSKNQTITIDSPFFQTSDCGEWQRLE